MIPRGTPDERQAWFFRVLDTFLAQGYQPQVAMFKAASYYKEVWLTGYVPRENDRPSGVPTPVDAGGPDAAPGHVGGDDQPGGTGRSGHVTPAADHG